METTTQADLPNLISNAYGAYHYGNCPTPLLDFDGESFTFQPDNSPQWVIPIQKFQEAVKTYMQEYHVKPFAAVCHAIKLEQWHKDPHGVLFYRV